MSGDLHIVVLAAGQGKRMHSSLPKVLHPVLFRPMLHHVLDLAKSLSPKTLSVVVGHGEDLVRKACGEYSGLQIVRQAEQKGTGHAVQQAAPLLEKKSGRVLVLCGDVLLLRKETIAALLESRAEGTVLTAHVEKPKGYGRILRDKKRKLLGICEEVDCTEKQRTIQEVNTGVYVFSVKALLPALGRLKNKNKQGEFYLTDVIEILKKDKVSVDAVAMENAREMIGINDRAALALVESVLRERTNEELMLSGVTIQDPASTWIDRRCKIAADVRIEAGCQIFDSDIGGGSVIESGCRVLRSKIGAGCILKQGCYIEDSQVGPKCSLGPFAHLRPESRLEEGVKIGNFVEIKKSVLKNGAKASHLSYIGDAEIGKEVNLGCGFITCNFDGGPVKHKTVIEDGVFVGSDSQTVAPVRIGRGSYVASGSTVTEDVPAESLVISRGRQTTKPGYAKKYRK